jgi:ParB-like chromosome segregation protein Spo0J
MASTPLHAVRIPDDLWQLAQAITNDNGETVTDVIRRALTDYTGADTPAPGFTGTVRDLLSTGTLEDRVDNLNMLRQLISEHSPFNSEPVDFVRWVKADQVYANDYNPNSVAPPEMELLRLSIAADGYTQPIVAMAEEDGQIQVIDGFHRHRVGKESPDIQARIHGYLPVVQIRDDRQDKADRIASTIRHNRARGKHQVVAMSDIVLDLKRRNWSDTKIGKELGMDPDEVLRLAQISGLAEAFKDHEFTEAWEAVLDADDIVEGDDSESLESIDD